MRYDLHDIHIHKASGQRDKNILSHISCMLKIKIKRYSETGKIKYSRNSSEISGKRCGS